MSSRPPAVLVILDGWGYSTDPFGNPTRLAKLPHLTRWYQEAPWALLAASGRDVGLPPGQAGNSEAGHLNIGAGRIVEQDSVRISHAINRGTFFKNAAFLEAIRYVARRRSTLHVFGMLTTDQSAHADPDHFVAILVLLRRYRVRSVVLHLFTDGRDSPTRDGLDLLRRIQRGLLPNEVIGTVMGRFYAMDRKKAWERTRAAYQALVEGRGALAQSAEVAIQDAYGRGQTDEAIPPTIIGSRTEHRVNDHDAVIFYNLRSDRARQLTKAFVQSDFVRRNPGAFRRRVLTDFLFVAMTSFGPDLPNVVTAFPSEDVTDTLPMVLGGSGRSQLYLAESEKFAHITFFFNGGYDHPVAGEDRRMLPSPDVDSYTATPAMAAPGLTRLVVEAVSRRTHDFIAVNLSNADMMGHSGDIPAAIAALEVVDRCLGQVHRAVAGAGGLLMVTADHGNVEKMLEPTTNAPYTEHSQNPVPLFVLRSGTTTLRAKSGRLADVAPTLLSLWGVAKPAAMTGTTLCRLPENPSS